MLPNPPQHQSHCRSHRPRPDSAHRSPAGFRWPGQVPSSLPAGREKRAKRRLWDHSSLRANSFWGRGGKESTNYPPAHLLALDGFCHGEAYRDGLRALEGRAQMSGFL